MHAHNLDAFHVLNKSCCYPNSLFGSVNPCSLESRSSFTNAHRDEEAYARYPDWDKECKA